MIELNELLKYLDNPKLLKRDDDLYSVLKNNLELCYNYLMYISKINFNDDVNISNNDCFIYFYFSDMCDNTFHTILDFYSYEYNNKYRELILNSRMMKIRQLFNLKMNECCISSCYDNINYFFNRSYAKINEVKGIVILEFDFGDEKINVKFDDIVNNYKNKFKYFVALLN